MQDGRSESVPLSVGPLPISVTDVGWGSESVTDIGKTVTLGVIRDGDLFEIEVQIALGQ